MILANEITREVSEQILSLLSDTIAELETLSNQIEEESIDYLESFVAQAIRDKAREIESVVAPGRLCSDSRHLSSFIEVAFREICGARGVNITAREEPSDESKS